MKDTMPVLQSGKTYMARLTANIVSPSAEGLAAFLTVFYRFFEKKHDAIDVPVKFFRVAEMSKEEKQKYIVDETPDHDLCMRLLEKTHDFLFFDGDMFLANVEKPNELDENGVMTINLSDAEAIFNWCPDIFKFELKVDFSKPIKEEEAE